MWSNIQGWKDRSKAFWVNQPNSDLEFAQDKIKKRNSLPFPAASEAFYQKQGYLSQHNENRTKYRTNFPVQKNEPKILSSYKNNYKD